VFTTTAKPSSIGERRGDIWFGRGATESDEEHYDGVVLVYDTTQVDSWRPCSTYAPSTGIGSNQPKPIGTMAVHTTKVGFMLLPNVSNERTWFPTTHLVDTRAAE
jgi:hypothetical protein